MHSKSLHIAVAIFALAAPLSSQAQPSYTAVAPDQRTRVELIARDATLAYSVSRDGVTVISQSPLGWFTNQGTLDGWPLQVAGVERKTVNVLSPISAAEAGRHGRKTVQP